MGDAADRGARTGVHAREAASAASEGPFRRLIEAAPDGIVISRQGTVLYANAAAARLLGYASEAELVGLSMASFLDADALSRMRERIAETQRGGVPLPPLEYAARRVDGAPVVAEITSLPIEYEGAPAVLAFARDVTERASLRARLERADRLAAVGRLAAGVAHEVNNPLTYVSLGLEALRRRIDGSLPEGSERAEALALVRQLRHGTDRVARIVRDLRAFARSEDERPSPVDLAAVLDSARRMVAHEVRPRAELVLEIPALPAVWADSGRLEQVFVNLLLNAAQALEEGKAGNVIAVRARVEEGRVLVDVIDNGPGIAADVVDKVFDPFFTTKPVGVGTGLGLSICATILRSVGGDISVVEAGAGGTTFRIDLPIAQGPRTEPAVEPRPAAATVHGSRARIAVIDDEPAVGSTLKALLGDHHDVVVDVDAARGIERLLGETFDVVLCDVMMPEVSGMDVFERVRSARSALAERFVFITGGAFTPRATEFLARVPNVRLEKPFSMSTIEATIRDVLDRLGAA